MAQKISVVCGGREYTYEPTSATTTIDTGYTGITNITGLTLMMKQNLNIDRTVYLKNVNMYALKFDPSAMPNAEITVGEFTDENLDTITSAEQLNGKKVFFNVSLTNYRLEDNQSYTLIVAAYDKATNKLIDLKYQSGTVAAGGTVNFESDENTALDLTGHTSGLAEIRVFAWNSLDGAIPLIGAHTHQF